MCCEFHARNTICCSAACWVPKSFGRSFYITGTVKSCCKTDRPFFLAVLQNLLCCSGVAAPAVLQNQLCSKTACAVSFRMLFDSLLNTKIFWTEKPDCSARAYDKLWVAPFPCSSNTQKHVIGDIFQNHKIRTQKAIKPQTSQNSLAEKTWLQCTRLWYSVCG